MVRPRPDALRPQLLTLVDSSCPYGRRRAWSTRRALSPPRGGRNASQVAPRACRARCARLPTRRKQRWAGSRSRTASNLQATHASCATLCMRLAPTGPHECCASAATVPKQLFQCVDRYPTRSGTSATPTLDTPGGAPRSVQSNPLCARTSSDLTLEIFGTTRLTLECTRPTMSYGTKTRSSHMENWAHEAWWRADGTPKGRAWITTRYFRTVNERKRGKQKNRIQARAATREPRAP